MRRCGPAKQCLWLGPGGYLSGGGRRFTYAYAHANAYAYAYAYANSNGYRYRDTYHDSSAITFADPDFNATAHSNSKRYSAIKASADSASSSVRIG
jgi:hypothetical protein